MTTITFPVHASAGLGTKTSLVQRVMDTLNEWARRSEGRKALAHMNAEELKDIGLSAGQAEWEASKAPWQA